MCGHRSSIAQARPSCQNTTTGIEPDLGDQLAVTPERRTIRRGPHRSRGRARVRRYRSVAPPSASYARTLNTRLTPQRSVRQDQAPRSGMSFRPLRSKTLPRSSGWGSSSSAARARAEAEPRELGDPLASWSPSTAAFRVAERLAADRLGHAHDRVGEHLALLGWPRSRSARDASRPRRRGSPRDARRTRDRNAATCRAGTRTRSGRRANRK